MLKPVQKQRGTFVDVVDGPGGDAHGFTVFPSGALQRRLLRAYCIDCGLQFSRSDTKLLGPVPHLGMLRGADALSILPAGKGAVIWHGRTINNDQFSR